MILLTVIALAAPLITNLFGALDPNDISQQLEATNEFALRTSLTVGGSCNCRDDSAREKW